MNENHASEIQPSVVAKEEKSLLSPDVTIFLLTLVTFFLLLAVLYKFAWKPILSALDKREDEIRKSVEEAARIKAELEKISEERAKVLREAEAKSKEILAESRKGAVEAAKVIQEKAKEEAGILLENARREIKDETEKAQALLRKESAHLAVGLAAKLIQENFDDEKNKKLIDDFIRKS